MMFQALMHFLGLKNIKHGHLIYRIKLKNTFKKKICTNSNLKKYIKAYPIELAYALALIGTNDVESILPAWVLKQHSYVETILENIRNVSCNNCSSAMNT